MKQSLILAALVCAASSVAAQQATTIPKTLDSVKIVASREAPELTEPMAITSLSRTEITRRSGLFLDEVLNFTPGLRMERRTMGGGQRITIRGYGNRTNFDGSGYKAYLNDIPITDAEGVTVLDDIDAGTLGRVDVIRGPASTMYGAGIGGVVHLYTLRPELRGTTATQEVTAGADGLQRYDTRLASLSAASTLLLNYGHQDYDSYHLHSASTKDHATFVGDFRPSERRTISTSLTYAHSYDQRAGQLDSAQFFNKENVGEAPYLNNDGHNDLESLRAGVTHRIQFNNRIENATTGYFTGVTREDVFAVGLSPKSSQSFGARTLFTTRFAPSLGPIVGNTGGEFQKTNAFAKSYALSNLVVGAPRTDLETATSQASLFSQWDLGLPSAFTLSVGGSVNFIEYAIRDRLANAANPTHADLSGRQVYDPVVTPRVSLRKGFGDDVSVWASVSQGYTPSTTGDAVIAATGEANTGLKPERGTQYEIGPSGLVLDNRLMYQLALFDLRISDKLTSQSVFDNGGTQLYAYTVNAGDQSNKGAELSLAYSVINDRQSALSTLRPFVTYAYSDFTFTDFKSNNNNNGGTVDYTGNQVPGVPKNVYTVGLDAAARMGLYGNATVEHVDAMPITNDNVHDAPAYSVLNAKLGVRRDVGRGLSLDVFAGGMNLTGSLYYTMVFLNGNYSGASPKVFLPGAPDARYYGGVKLSYHR
jgi:iron complex outermembrane receptor protein